MARAPCPLLDLPAVAIQDVLQRMSGTDVARLRLASRQICRLATQHTPYISLHLSPSSNPEYPLMWCQATKQLQHVSSIHIYIAGKVAPELFELTMKSLSQRCPVKELCLLGIQSTVSRASYSAVIPNLQPICYLKTSLKILVLKDLVIQDTVTSIANLADLSSDEWQLQRLTLAAACFGNGNTHAAQFSVAVMSLVQAFPCLQQLNLEVPPLAPDPQDCQHRHGAVHIAAVAIREAIGKMQHLELLTVSELPDLWSGHATGKATVPPLAEPAAFRSMEDLGCWLLQQQPKLVQLEMSCGRWTICWRNEQQHQQRHSSGTEHPSSAAATTAAAATMPLASIKANYHCSTLPRSGAAESSSLTFRDSFMHHISHYSLQPASGLLRPIVSCQLALNSDQAIDGSLAGVLREMKSLKDLKISLLISSYHEHSATASMAAVVAAAAVPGLRSLDLLTGWSTIEVTPELLLPLTAAAGGPGNSLEKLQLRGRYAAATAGEIDSGWCVLKQLRCLRELKVHQLGSLLLVFPISSLPSALEVFKGHRLHLVSGTPVTTAAAAGISHQVVRTGGNLVFGGQRAAVGEAAAGQRLGLRVLDLQLCWVRDASILTSFKQLQELSVSSSEWPDRLPPAAAAWPLLQKLVLWFAGEQNEWFCNFKCCTSELAAEAAGTLFRDISVGCPGLSSLAVQNLPHLSIEKLQPVVDRMKHLQHLSLSGCGLGTSIGSNTAEKVNIEEWLMQQLPWATVRLAF